MTQELESFYWEEIEFVEEIVDGECYDICLLENDVYLNEPNYIANGFIVHNSGMHDAYASRKRGKEEYDLHPLIQPILGGTYGVMIFQEQTSKILNVIGDIPQKDCEVLRKAISKKREDQFLEYKDIFIENAQKNLGWNKEEVEDLWKQIESFSGYGFCKAHAVCYTYISSQLLYLKSHYPLEFFASILECEGSSDKIKEYKIEAAKHNIKIMPLDINKSKDNFEIVDDLIYIGFSNIKGIGADIAKEIIKHQPYNSFHDFLTKFGTDASVLKPLIGLRMFDDADPVTLYKYAEWVRKFNKKKEDQKKRHDKTEKQMKNDVNELISSGLDENKIEELKKFKKKYDLFVSRYNSRKLPDTAPCLQDFLDGGFDKDIEISDELANIYASKEEAERAYYGFLWTHPLEKSPDYESDMSFEDFRNKDCNKGYVQVLVISVVKTLAKNKKTSYWLMKAEDVNGEVNSVQVWEDDWLIFSDELKPAAMVKMEIQRPTKGFKRYTFSSPPKHLRWRDVPKDKAKDFRLIVMENERGEN